MAGLRIRCAPRPHPLAVCLAAALCSAPAGAARFDPSMFDALHRARAELERTTGRHVDIVSLAPSGTPNAQHVANCNDSGPGSLRGAIAAAGDFDVIDLTHLACSRITLTSGELVSTQSRLSLLGPGAAALTIDAGGASRVFSHTGTIGLRIAGLTIIGGATDGAGGCIRTASTIGLYDTIVSSCSASGNGGAVYATTQFFMDRSTLANSTSTGGNGGGAFSKGGFTGLVESTLSGNTAPGGRGGGIVAYDTIYLSRSTLMSNTALQGGGVAASMSGDAFVDLAGSTISGNHATRGGGADVEASLRLVDSTLAFNTAEALGGGLYSNAAVAIEHTIVAGNTAESAANDIDGALGIAITGANNIVMASPFALPADTMYDDPLLAPLADNGGFTLTHALLSGSVAIGHGNNHSFMRYDQRYRGSARIIGAAPDIGAYEVQTIGTNRVVANCDDTGDGSLRDAIDHAESGDTIDLSKLGCGRIVLSHVLEVGVGTLTMNGPGANALVVDGGVVDRVIDQTAYGTLTLSGLTIGYGAAFDYGSGGCISAISTLDVRDAIVKSCEMYGTTNGVGGGISAARLVLTRSTVSGNFAMGQLNASGGGIAVAGDFTMRDSDVTGNRAVTTYDHIEPKAESRAGGILASRGGSVTISGSTISGNVAGNASLKLPGYFGGIAMYGAYGAPALIENTTITGNSAASVNGGLYATRIVRLVNSTIAFNIGETGAGYLGPFSAGVHVDAPWLDLSSTIVANNATTGSLDDLSGSAEVIGANALVRVATIPMPADTLTDDPMLAGLGFNGGPTPTHALLPGSPAIDRGNNDAGLANDQRGVGFARVAGAGADIGAYEVQAAGPADPIFADGFDG
jgi:hypothetical protein